MSTDNLRGGGFQGLNLVTLRLSYSELVLSYTCQRITYEETTTRNKFNSTAIVHTAVRSLHFYSDRETTDNVLHLLVLKNILEIAWDVALTRIKDQSIGQK